MIQIEAHRVRDAAFGSRLARLPFVLLLAISLMLSLFQCANCDFGLSGAGDPTVTASNDSGATPDVPEGVLPCNCGHCTSHMMQMAFSDALPLDFPRGDHDLREERSLLAPMTAQLFKPPRA